MLWINLAQTLPLSLVFLTPWQAFFFFHPWWRFNVKLDIITAEFTEVKNAIDWSTVVVSYGSYERKIRAAEENLNRIYSVQRQARENEKENFNIQYESDVENSVQKLYDVIVYNDHVISDNIIQVVVQQTKNHKRKTEQFSLGLVQLLIQGIKVKVSYYGMKEWATDHLVTEWETKMTKLRDTLQTVSDVVKSLYLSQMRLDTKDLILSTITASATRPCRTSFIIS